MIELPKILNLISSLPIHKTLAALWPPNSRKASGSTCKGPTQGPPPTCSKESRPSLPGQPCQTIFPDKHWYSLPFCPPKCPSSVNMFMGPSQGPLYSNQCQPSQPGQPCLTIPPKQSCKQSQSSLLKQPWQTIPPKQIYKQCQSCVPNQPCQSIFNKCWCPPPFYPPIYPPICPPSVDMFMDKESCVLRPPPVESFIRLNKLNKNINNKDKEKPKPRILPTPPCVYKDYRSPTFRVENQDNQIRITKLDEKRDDKPATAASLCSKESRNPSEMSSKYFTGESKKRSQCCFHKHKILCLHAHDLANVNPNAGANRPYHINKPVGRKDLNFYQHFYLFMCTIPLILFMSNWVFGKRHQDKEIK